MLLCESPGGHELLPEAEHDAIVPWPSDELKANGQAIVAEPAGTLRTGSPK